MPVLVKGGRREFAMSTGNADQLPEPPTKVDEAVNERDEPGGGASFPIVGVGASAGGLEAFINCSRRFPQAPAWLLFWCSTSRRRA
jgi:chemotaxis response regulator CheB